MVGISGEAPPWLKTGLLLPLVALNAWIVIQVFQYFEPLLTILIAAAVLAFVLNYPVEWLRQWLDRTYAVLLVLLTSLVALVAIGITLVPALLEQFSAILDQLPTLLEVAIAQLQSLQDWAMVHHLPINLNQVTRQFADNLPTQIEGLGDETLFLTLNAVGGLSSLFLTLVLTFYLLLDGKRIWRALFQRLPLKHPDRIRRSLQEDFHQYFIGQATLSLIMTVALSIVLVVLHIPYSLLLGAIVGVLSLIPFGDWLGYALVCLLVAAQSPGLALITLGIVIVLDQLLDQAIAPRILGDFTGLKPIWVILALLLGTKLFGFPGLLLAVPIASSISTFLEDEATPQEESAAETEYALPASKVNPSRDALRERL